MYTYTYMHIWERTNAMHIFSKGNIMMKLINKTVFLNYYYQLIIVLKGNR